MRRDTSCLLQCSLVQYVHSMFAKTIFIVTTAIPYLLFLVFMLCWRLETTQTTHPAVEIIKQISRSRDQETVRVCTISLIFCLIITLHHRDQPQHAASTSNMRHFSSVYRRYSIWIWYFSNIIIAYIKYHSF